MAKNIKLIIGSTRQNRLGPQVAAWAEKSAAQSSLEIEVVDLKDVNLPAFDAPVPPAYAPTETEDGKKWAELIGNSEGFIFVTPEYNRSIPSSLKNAIDYLVAEWKNKPAVIVSYGYVDGGKSASNHLTDILNWLKMDIIDPTVHLQLSQDLFNEDGTFIDIDEAFKVSESTYSDAIEKLAK